MIALTYIIAFACFFINNMYYFPTYIRSYVGSGGKEDAAADGHGYHAYTYMLAFTFELLYVLSIRCPGAL